MRFQTKIIVGYAILVFALALIIGFWYHSFTFSQYEKTEETNMKVISEQLMVQVEERINRMELVMEYILSDPSILDGIQILAKAGEGNIHRKYIEEAKTNIRAGISTYYITNNFYRTIVFNQNGDMFATYNHRAKRAKTEVAFDEMPYLKRADDKLGKPILISDHIDPWGFQENPQVFSMLKSIQGKNMGYIEVQYQVTDFSNLQLPKEEVTYLIVVNGEELLYTSGELHSLLDYEDLLAEEGEIVKKVQTSDGTEVVAAKSTSEIYPVTIIPQASTKEIGKASSYIRPMTFCIALAFFGVSMVFVSLLSRILTKPLRQLRLVMENTQLENLGEDVAVDAPNDEIEALSVSYQDVMGRLQKSMVKEQRLSVLQLQAQFDSLQAQVNPHFLYNVLNIISARGMGSGDEKICEMCQSLADMLRYSTGNVNRFASVREELQYLQQYFYLLKARYEHKIEFRVDVDEAVKDELIPKVALQQIVENCINHGFENTVEKMCVDIKGWRDGESWYIKIHDNGQGFKAEVLKELAGKMKDTKRRILKERSNMELEIGGMGLINTYARCLLMYNDNLVFEIKNGENGADVILGSEKK